MTTLIVLGIISVLAWLFGQKMTEEKKVNDSKIPRSVKRWKPQVTQAAKEFNVPLDIAMSVLWTESRGDANAVGSAGEVGLFQLKEIAVRDLKLQGFGDFVGWDRKPEQNIRAGVAYLKLQYNRTKRAGNASWFTAVKAYNQGWEGMKDNPGKAKAYLDRVKKKEKFFA